jgi:hypothetical protein
MKKIIIGALVGGLLIFIWQSLSWTVLDLHRPTQDYTAKQDTILSVLSSNLTEGGYLMPTVPKGASMDEAMKKSDQSLGKPWAMIQYHASYDATANSMYMNMLKGFLCCVLIVAFLCWILSRWAKLSFGSVFIASILTGLIVFLNEPYNQHIWYQSFDIKAHLVDALASWGLCGVWLGWWMKRK